MTSKIILPHRKSVKNILHRYMSYTYCDLPCTSEFGEPHCIEHKKDWNRVTRLLNVFIRSIDGECNRYIFGLYELPVVW